MTISKLDTYDYIILPGVIRIRVEGTNDPALVDILSEISNANSRIYVEGCYYEYLNSYRLFYESKTPYMELDVVQTA